jgi:hypothetical protein
VALGPVAGDTVEISFPLRVPRPMARELQDPVIICEISVLWFAVFDPSAVVAEFFKR